MKKLTENLVQQRLKTCTTDLDKVLQINITGRELEDVSLLKKMTGVEILSLSVNQISSLRDFQFCKNLKELYLRNNNISDLKQIYYLINLPKLKLLMLSQNPCADDPLYRPTVIRNLQVLTELDGIHISPEERQKAFKSGLNLLKLDSNGLFESDSSEEIRIRGLPPAPTQSEIVKEEEKIENDVSEIPSNHEMITLLSRKTSLDFINKDEMSYHSSKTLNLNEKEANQLNQREIRGMKLEKPPKHLMCKFCKGQAPDSLPSIRLIPKNPNLLSAALNLIKELDYSSLQIVQAELISILNAFEVDLFIKERNDAFV